MSEIFRLQTIYYHKTSQPQWKHSASAAPLQNVWLKRPRTHEYILEMEKNVDYFKFLSFTTCYFPFLTMLLWQIYFKNPCKNFCFEHITLFWALCIHKNQTDGKAKQKKNTQKDTVMLKCSPLMFFSFSFCSSPRHSTGVVCDRKS